MICQFLHVQMIFCVRQCQEKQYCKLCQVDTFPILLSALQHLMLLPIPWVSESEVVSLTQNLFCQPVH